MSVTSTAIIAILAIMLNVITLGDTMAQDTLQKESAAELRYSLNEAERYFAATLNNKVWDLLAKTDRTREDDEMMIHAAHASFYHWSVVGKPVNVARGFWLISHVYAVLKQVDPAIHYANRCLDVTQAEALIDFDLAYAYEGMARAYAAAGNKAKCEEYLKLTQDAGGKIKNKEDRDVFSSDFKAGPWYGMK